MLELLIYITIMTMILLITSTVGLDIIQNQRRAAGVQRLHQGVRTAVALMNYDLRSAQSIATSTSVFDTPTSTLSIVSDGASPVRYTLSGGMLTRSVGAGTAEIVTPSNVVVEAFTVRYLSHATKTLEGIRIGITAHTGSTTTEHFYRQTYTTSITRR